MDVYIKIILKIIDAQESIVGPVAIEQAKKVTNLSINWPKHSVKIKGDPMLAIDSLVQQYSKLFGKVSVEVCKEASSHYLTELEKSKKPSSLI